MDKLTRIKSRLLLTAGVVGLFGLGAVGISVYLVTRPASQNPFISAKEPASTSANFNRFPQLAIPTATPIPIPPELPTIFKSFDPQIIPSPTPTPWLSSVGAPGESQTQQPTEDPGPTLSEAQKQEAIQTLEKLDKMPTEFKAEFLEWLKKM